MRRRVIELTGVLAVLAAVIVLLQLASATIEGQTPEPGAGVRTAWGAPDLQGIWTTNYDTPLQRPARYADREFFTEEERAAIDSERMRLLGTRRSERGSEQDVGGAYDASIFLTHKHLGRRTSLIIDPPDGQLPAVTPEVQARRNEMNEYHRALLQSTDACKEGRPGCPPSGPRSPRWEEAAPHYLTRNSNRAYGPEDRSLSERCIGARLPDFGGSTGFFLQVVQGPGTVSIFYDTGQGQGWQRVIPVTDRPHLPPDVRQWWGDSRGRWEGDALVVDVTNFSPKTDFYGARENLHVVERWRRIDAETLEYVATMEDPTTWVRPWTVTLELSLQSNEANRIYKEPRCHEGNYGLPGLLAGGRAGEQAFAEGRGPDPASLCIAGGTTACGGFGGGFAEEGDEADPLQR